MLQYVKLVLTGVVQDCLAQRLRNMPFGTQTRLDYMTYFGGRGKLTSMMAIDRWSSELNNTSKPSFEASSRPAGS